MQSSMHVAIIGGGLAGTSAALQLSKNSHVQVDVYDWGRQPGGRSATRNVYVNKETGKETYQISKEEDVEIALQFDHGLQFIETNDTGFIQALRDANAVEWSPRSGWLSGGTFLETSKSRGSGNGGNDGFFNALARKIGSKTFVSGKDGMSGLCASIQEQATKTGRVRVQQQRRVVSIERANNVCGGSSSNKRNSNSNSNNSSNNNSSSNNSNRPQWWLKTDDGHHEQDASILDLKDRVMKEKTAYDAVIFTEHMMWLPPWHPCSLENDLMKINKNSIRWVREHLNYNETNRRFDSVAALFTLMVAFEITDETKETKETEKNNNKWRENFLNIETACLKDDVLQYVVNQNCRNGKNKGKLQRGAHCWVLVSTRAFADKCLNEESMSKEREDSKSGSDITYVPQEEKYLRAEPSEIMLSSFYHAIGITKEEDRPTVLYKRCQRWGGAYTLAPSKTDKKTSALINHGDIWEICASLLNDKNHLISSNSGLYCAGDYIYPSPSFSPTIQTVSTTATFSFTGPGDKESRVPPMDENNFYYIKALIDKHGQGNYKIMAKDIELNTKKLTMGRIIKMCQEFKRWMEYVDSTSNDCSKSFDVMLESSSFFLNRRASRSFKSGRSAALKILSSLLICGTPANRKTCLEVCCGSLDSVEAAILGGCHRIELCSALSSGGLTPTPGLLKSVYDLVDGRVPINVLLRPREGDFVYSQREMDVMLEDIPIMAKYGASGIVLGVLTVDGEIDVVNTTRLIRCTRQCGMSVTFHRAIDVTKNLLQSLDVCVEMGVDRILTSGGASSIVEGQQILASLVERANGCVPPIVIMAGAGLSEFNVKPVIEFTGVHECHGSLTKKIVSKMNFQRDNVKMGNQSNENFRLVCDQERVRKVVEIMKYFDKCD